MCHSTDTTIAQLWPKLHIFHSFVIEKKLYWLHYKHFLLELMM